MTRLNYNDHGRLRYGKSIASRRGCHRALPRDIDFPYCAKISKVAKLCSELCAIPPRTKRDTYIVYTRGVLVNLTTKLHYTPRCARILSDMLPINYINRSFSSYKAVLHTGIKQPHYYLLKQY